MANGKRNRSAGHGYEREEVFHHKKFFPYVGTTRQFNRARDGDGIDICNSDESVYGRLVLDLSCKTSISPIPYIKLFRTKMPQHPSRIRVILHQHCEKSNGGKFMVKSTYTILEREGYEKLLACAVALNHIRSQNPGIIEKLESIMGVSLLDIPANQLEELDKNLKHE